jgi:hypothetical protein
MDTAGIRAVLRFLSRRTWLRSFAASTSTILAASKN